VDTYWMKYLELMYSSKCLMKFTVMEKGKRQNLCSTLHFLAILNKIFTIFLVATLCSWNKKCSYLMLYYADWWGKLQQKMVTNGFIVTLKMDVNLTMLVHGMLQLIM
jgi:hypothetical protein